jgi:predicted lactoylglutathione lyase
MSRKIFVNLPVSDLDKSKTFFSALGFTFNPQFTDESAACMVISEDIYAMLLTEKTFATFTPYPLCDATKQTEVLIALSCESRDEVGQLMDKALSAGGRRYSEPKDHGFMLHDGFQDLDGHIWELFYMDPAAIQPNG